MDTEVSGLAEQAEVAEPVSDNREEAQTEEAAQEDKTAIISSEENTKDADRASYHPVKGISGRER